MAIVYVEQNYKSVQLHNDTVSREPNILTLVIICGGLVCTALHRAA